MGSKGSQYKAALWNWSLLTAVDCSDYRTLPPRSHINCISLWGEKGKNVSIGSYLVLVKSSPPGALTPLHL